MLSLVSQPSVSNTSERVSCEAALASDAAVCRALGIRDRLGCPQSEPIAAAMVIVVVPPLAHTDTDCGGH